MRKTRVTVLLRRDRARQYSPDSFGVYSTYDTKIDRLESDRNCIAMIRREGLNYEKEAFKMAWNIENAFGKGKTGIELKDRSDDETSHRIVKPKMHLL